MCTEYVYFSEHSLAFICASEITDQAKIKGSMCQLVWQVGVLEWETCEGPFASRFVCVRVCITLWSAGDV